MFDKKQNHVRPTLLIVRFLVSLPKPWWSVYQNVPSTKHLFRLNDSVAPISPFFSKFTSCSRDHLVGLWDALRIYGSHIIWWLGNCFLKHWSIESKLHTKAHICDVNNSIFLTVFDCNKLPISIVTTESTDNFKVSLATARNTPELNLCCTQAPILPSPSVFILLEVVYWLSPKTRGLSLQRSLKSALSLVYHLTKSYPFSERRLPRTSPTPASSVTGFLPIGSATKLRCFWDVEDIMLQSKNA